MSRLHIHLSVDDLEQNIRFYSALFGAAPGVSKDDYARWDLEEPAVNFAISSRGARPGLDHIGIQSENAGELAAVHARLEAAGVSSVEQTGTTCCYARSDKYWTRDPQGIAWEAFHTLESIPASDCRDANEATAASGCCVPAMPGSSCGGP
jgi:catechol 2,3-dioxygenase-like lactoylglutathione lyase family enzyme